MGGGWWGQMTVCIYSIECTAVPVYSSLFLYEFGNGMSGLFYKTSAVPLNEAKPVARAHSELFYIGA